MPNEPTPSPSPTPMGAGGAPEADLQVRYIVHPTPPNASGERRLCAHVVARKTYAMEEFAEEVAREHQLLDAATVLHVLRCMHKTTQRLLRSGNSIAFKNQFTMQLSIAGSLEPGETPDPARGHQLRPRVRIAPAFIEAINRGITFAPAEGKGGQA